VCSPEVDRLTTCLPAEQAEALRDAVRWAASHSWPVAAFALLPLPEPDEDDDVRDESGEAAEMAPRLAELPGRVVRVSRLIEIHISDTQRFRAAMAEDGWEPLPADQLAADDPDDLVGAVMTATDDLPPCPAHDRSPKPPTPSCSTLPHGDELLDWSPTPVVVDFGPGWRRNDAA